MTQQGPDYQPARRHPPYHGAVEDARPADAGQQPAARQRRIRVLVMAIVAAVLLAIVIMHLTGAMPTGTGF